MRAIVLFFLISGMLTACGGSDSNDKNKSKTETRLQVISSIKPIQMIVLAIAGDYSQSEQLIPDYASPHNYSFKPSDIRKVKKADVVFRIDEHMESQLNAIFENIESSTKLISLAEAKGLKLLESGDSHQEHESDAKDKHESDKYENIDFHIWTSPINATIIAGRVTKTLSELDRKNAKNYQQNFKKFSESLQLESEIISARLAKYQSSDYVVFHNSWQYFAKEFGLQKPIVIDSHEGVSSGAKTISETRQKIDKDNIRCVFYDASISEARLKLLTEKLISKKLNTIKIDVLANDIEIDQSAYVNWLKQLAAQIETCLSHG